MKIGPVQFNFVENNITNVACNFPSYVDIQPTTNNDILVSLGMLPKLLKYLRDPRYFLIRMFINPPTDLSISPKNFRNNKSIGGVYIYFEI